MAGTAISGTQPRSSDKADSAARTHCREYQTGIDDFVRVGRNGATHIVLELCKPAAGERSFETTGDVSSSRPWCQTAQAGPTNSDGKHFDFHFWRRMRGSPCDV